LKISENSKSTTDQASKHQVHASAASNGDSKGPSAQTSDQPTVQSAERGMGFMNGLDPQMLARLRPPVKLGNSPDAAMEVAPRPEMT